MDDLVKKLNELNAEIDGLIPDWLFDQAERIEDIVTILPDDVIDALTIISVAIDLYAAKHHLGSSLVWKALTDVSEEVHKESGDYEL